MAKRRVRDRARRAAQTVEQRQACLQCRRDRLNVESAEEREARLQQMRERIAAESAEEREARLQQMRDRLAAESSVERETRLQQMRINQSETLAAESTEEREARLLRMQDRLAAESAGEREARLQRMRINQSERLAAESVEEREDRRQRASGRETHANREEPLKQCSVQMKMRKFHENFATLNSSKCSTCSESFPCIKLCFPITECMRCYRDKHTPKLYSSANVMDPGPSPSQLQVSKFIYFLATIIIVVHSI